jgi:hypothetical protein
MKRRQAAPIRAIWAIRRYPMFHVKHPVCPADPEMDGQLGLG